MEDGPFVTLLVFCEKKDDLRMNQWLTAFCSRRECSHENVFIEAMAAPQFDLFNCRLVHWGGVFSGTLDQGKSVV